MTTSGSSAAPPEATRRSASRNSSHVGHAVLEQVADPARVAGDQIDRVALLDVLGEHQDRHVRPLLADHERGLDALVVERRRHPHVDDAHVRLVLGDGAQQRLAVVDRVDDLEAALLEQPRKAFAQQHRVLGDHGSHGSSTRSVVPVPGGLTTMKSPSMARTRSRSPLRPMPAGVGAADAVVEDLDDEPVVLVFGGQPGSSGARVLGDVRQRLGDDEVGDRLARSGRRGAGGRRRPPPGTGQRAARAETAASRPRSVSTAGWMPRARLRSSTSASLASPCASSTSRLRHAPGPRSRGRARASWPARRAAAARRRAGRARSGAARRRRRRPCPRGSPRACRRGRSGARARPAPAAAAPSPPARRRRRATSHGAAYSAPAPNATWITALAAKPMCSRTARPPPSGAQPHSGKVSSASAAPQPRKTRNAPNQPTNGSATSAVTAAPARSRASASSACARTAGEPSRGSCAGGELDPHHGARRAGAPTRASTWQKTNASAISGAPSEREDQHRDADRQRHAARKMNEIVPSAALSAT